MCGIAGIYERNKDNKALMRSMLKSIEHRGPDDSSVFSHNDFTLGHRRLAIIDLVSGNQPIFNENRTLCVIFNGEIYNYKEIKSDLEKKSHKFLTKTDTEVLIHGYEEYGTNLFEKLNGIFAFALLDLKNNKLILVRDQFGIKPLHYYFKNGILIFSSEQKAILLHKNVNRNINYQSLHSHLNLRYTQNEETLFDGIKRLPPAHFLIFSNDSISINRYWKLVPEVQPGMTENEAIDKMNFYIKQAVERQLMSDVPLGVYLSGGIDSSTIVAKMHELNVEQINSFTLGFNEPTDEFKDAETVANHFETNHRTASLTNEPLQNLPEVIRYSEEPKINLLQGFKMSNFVRDHVKVVLGGLGGDELFAGYDIHKLIYPFNKLHNKVPASIRKLLNWKSDFLFRVQNSSKIMSIDEYRRGLQMLFSIGEIEKFYLIIRNVWDYDQGFYDEIYDKNMSSYFKENVSQTNTQFHKYFSDSGDLSPIDQVLYTEFHTKMVNDYLLVEDRMSMAHSVEERVPLLDIDLVNFGFSIPVELKIKRNTTKYLFRKAMSDQLPEKIISKKKWGFTVNPYLQFKKDLREVAKNILTKNFIKDQGIFNYEYIKRIIDYPPNPKLRWHYNYLWIVVGFAIWDKMFIRSDDFLKKDFNIEEYFN